MKLIFLNIWGGHEKEALHAFIREQIATTDVFCFQEARERACVDFLALLTGYHEVRGPYKVASENDAFAQVVYVSKKYSLEHTEVLFEKDMEKGQGIVAEIKAADGGITVCNFHGMSRPVNKLDDLARIATSKALITAFEDKKGLKIIGGDFNLFPETQSVGMFADHGYVNLIKEYGITNTRNHFAWDRYPDSKQYHSSFIFVSKDVKVKSFTVPDVEVSDHQPLVLEIGE